MQKSCYLKFLNKLQVFHFRSRGKWGNVMTRGKMIFRSTGFNIQMASFDI